MCQSDPSPSALLFLHFASATLVSLSRCVYDTTGRSHAARPVTCVFPLPPPYLEFLILAGYFPDPVGDVDFRQAIYYGHGVTDDDFDSDDASVFVYPV